MPPLPEVVTLVETPRKLPPINNVAELIRAFMELKIEQVVIYNPSWTIPEDDRLYITVAFLGGRPYGSSREYHMNADESALIEAITINKREDYSINIYSRSDEALNRKDEVVQAFNSTFAQQLSEALSIKMSLLPISFVDLSQLEGAARIYRYNLTIPVLCAKTTERVTQYFNPPEIPPKGLVIDP